MTREKYAVMALAALAAVTGCVAPGTPVPVAGDVQVLAGEWEGSYSSVETGRSGSIVFRLKAGTDSAFGDVVMVPARADLPPAGAAPVADQPMRQMPRVINISFVRCAEGDVTGLLEPYQDPDTGQRIFTRFQGRLKGNTLEGTFVSVYEGSGNRTSGTWLVARRDRE
jgi:hypothetical protein